MGKQSQADLHALAVFVNVVETKSFSAAARRLDTTTSAVSKRVARLEERLGVRLFARTTRRVSLTEAGTTFYGHASKIIADVDAAESAVARLGGAVRGTLRATVPVIFGERHVAPLLAGLLEKHPELRVEMSFADRVVNLVEEGFDLALRIGGLDDSSLVAVRVAETDAVVCASPGYLARRGTPKTPDDLASHECIRYSLISAAREWRFRRGGREHAVPVAGRLELSHGGAIARAAEGGAGIARLPRFLVQDALASGTLVSILDAWPTGAYPINVVHPSAPHASPKVRAFVDWIRPRLRSRLTLPR